MIAYTFYASDPRVRREAESLASRGDQVDFICLREPGDSMQLDFGGVKLHPLSTSRYQGTNALRYIGIYLSFFILSSLLVTRLYFRNRYEIIQVHTMPDFLVFAAAIPKLLGAKIILDVHDLMPELYMCKFGGNSKHWLVRLITWLERRSVAFSHRAIAVHVPHRDALVSHGNPEKKFGVLINVPDPAIFQQNSHRLSDGKFRLIYHGTVARRHGLEVALKAVRFVRDEIPNLEFHIIGRGDDLGRVKGLAVDLGLTDCVRFTGAMPTHELPRQLTQADIGLVPILYDSFTRYMLPLKLLEYVRMGIPCIVSETETIRTYFSEDMVRYCKPGDECELAKAILELHREPGRRSQLVVNSARFNASYNWSQQRKSYFNLVDSLLPVSKN